MNRRGRCLFGSEGPGLVLAVGVTVGIVVVGVVVGVVGFVRVIEAMLE